MIYVFCLVALGISGFGFMKLSQLEMQLDQAKRNLQALQDTLKKEYLGRKETILEYVEWHNKAGKKHVPVVTYLPSKKKIPYLTKKNLLHLALDNDVDIATACGGVGNCGMCALDIHEGAENLPELNKIEESFLGAMMEGQQRLACQCHPKGDITVEGVN